MKRSIDEMNEFIKKKQAIDATYGGLVLGNSHDEGGIYFWVKRGDYYVLEGELEGFEFILNLGANDYFKKATERFHQPELHKNDYTKYIPSKEIKLLDTRKLNYPNYLLFESGGFAIINKYSTKGYLKTLDKMNKATSFVQIDKETAKLVHHLNEDIEIYYYDKYEGYMPKRK
jgi:hypothetical protein